MPTYDYECKACGHSFDVFQSMSEQPLTLCPACRKQQLRRLIGGGVGIIFKGSGFYVNDSRSKTSSATASSGSNGKDSADAAKPAEKTAASNGKSAAAEKSGDSGKSGSVDGANSEKSAAAAK